MHVQCPTLETLFADKILWLLFYASNYFSQGEKRRPEISLRFAGYSTPGEGGGGGGAPHIKGVRMLVVSLINFGFWCHLGCSGHIFSREGLV